MINLCSESFRQTCQSLRDAGLVRQPELLSSVSNKDDAWEAEGAESL